MTETTLVNQQDNAVKVGINTKITANMRVEYAKILRKYDVKKLELFDLWRSENYNSAEVSPEDYLKIYKMQQHINSKKDNGSELLFEMYSFEMVKDFAQYLFTDVADKNLLQMISTPESELWNKQDLTQLKEVLLFFRQTV